MAFTNFSRDVFHDFGTVPKRGLMYCIAVGILFTALDLVAQFYKIQSLKIFLSTAIFFIIAGIIATYGVIFSILDRSLSFTGMMKFICTTVAMVSPIFIIIGAFLFFAESIINRGTVLMIVGATFLPALLLAFLLPAWPVAQSLTKGFVSPVRVLRATKGHRWALVLMAMIIGGLNRLAPDSSGNVDAFTAVLLSLCQGVVSAASTLLASCIAVSAWKYASVNDPSLNQKLDYTDMRPDTFHDDIDFGPPTGKEVW